MLMIYSSSAAYQHKLEFHDLEDVVRQDDGDDSGGREEAAEAAERDMLVVIDQV